MLRAIGVTFLLVLNASVICVGQSAAQNRVSSTSGRATQMNDCAANKTLVRKLFDEWVNKKNLAAIDGMVTPNYVSHEGGEDTNAEDTKKFLADLFRSAPTFISRLKTSYAKAIKWWSVIYGAQRTRADSEECLLPERVSSSKDS